MTKVPTPYSGSCLCAAIKYEVDVIEPQMAHCHCTMCRKFHGAAFATFGEAKRENFRWLQGEERLREYVGSNGSSRFFCDCCGSSLIFQPAGGPGLVVEFAASSLDCEINEKPDAHIYTRYGASWLEMPDGLPKHREGRDE